ncbi:MAG: response regulator [Oscillospiraceae bacterium]|nr:response regulator [Oscillospiraceae bacterium]
MKLIEKSELSQVSLLTILLCFSAFAAGLSAEAILMKWELWPLLPIIACVVISWILHIQQIFSEKHRCLIYAAFVLFAFFYYGSHITSIFDTVAVMSVILILFTMTGVKQLITLLQTGYYITFGYGLLMLRNSGETFDSLLISRTILHFFVITAICVISRTLIDKWSDVFSRTHDEIDKLTEETNLLNDFLTNVSHETRTPINAIIGLSSICIDEEKNADRCTNLISIRNAGRRVAEQISDILDFSEIDRNRLKNNCEDYMLSSVLNDLVEELRSYKPEEIELVFDVDPAIPSVMYTDIGKLRKILRHLIINGIKYTREGGIYVRLHAIRESYGVNLNITVKDTGIGMTEDELARIYERYYQVDSGRARKDGGLGLGMTIVSGFTASLGGFMTISSSPGSGTTVNISLPQKVIEPASCMSVSNPDKLCLGSLLLLDKYPNPNVREFYNLMIRNIVKGFDVKMHRADNIETLKKLLNSVRLTHLFVSMEGYVIEPELFEKAAESMIVVVIANPSFKLPAGSKARIMEKPFYCFPVAAVLNSDRTQIEEEEYLSCEGVQALTVDDEPMNLIVVKNILKRYGITVTEAQSGFEAIEICQEREFDIIFMDHMMPGMDGIEAMKRIRSGNAKKGIDTPIVALTANAVSTARETFISAGFNGFVSKPIELVELERVLRKLLPQRALTVKKPLQQQPASTVAAVAAFEAAPPETAEQAQENTLSVMKRLEECGLDTAEALRYCADDPEFYLTLVQQTVTESNEKQQKLSAYFADRDLKNYEILVHALKNTLKLIGSSALSERAKELEFAAKDNDYALIAQKHEALISDYRQLTARLQEICGEAPEAAPEEPEEEIMDFPPEMDSSSDEDDIIEFESFGEEG